MTTSSSDIVIKESCELPINYGKIEVDTSLGSIIIFMKTVPAHKSDESLTISKISHDNNSITLLSETTLINGADITIFGLPSYAKFKKGKNKSLVLKSNGTNWKIIKEE